MKVIVAAATPQPSFEKSRNNRHQLKRDVQEAGVTLERADIDAAIAMALKQLAETEGYQREIHFISDFQRSNWAAVNYAAIPENVKTVFVSVAEEAAGNVAITEVTLKPPDPAISEEVSVVCKVANFGGQRRDVPLELAFSNEKVSRHTLSLQPGTTGSTTFRLRPHRSGIFEGVLTIPDDGLAADNTRYFTLSVTERVHVTILSDETEADPAAGSRFLRAAVNPFTDETGVLVPAVMRPELFDKFVAARSQVVIVSGVQPFSADTAKSLVQYLRDGGGLIYFLSHPSDRENLALIEKHSNDDLKMPFTIGRFIDSGSDTDAEFAMLSEANYDAPMLRKFRETGALAKLNFFRYFTTQRLKTRGSVLLRYDNSHIALARTSLGFGSLLLANFSLASDSCDLPKHLVFVPLIHEMIHAMRPESGGARSFTVGHPCSTTITFSSPDSSIRFTSPSGEEISAGLELSKNEGAVVFGSTHATGFYRVYAENTRLGSIAVNVDNRESNLDSITPDQIRELSRISKERFFATAGKDSGALRRLREGVPLWHYLLICCMCLLALEQMVAMIWKR